MKKSYNKGITLISLIITVIVMLILAGIAINITIGDNGIFTKTNTAKEISQINSYQEQIELVRTELTLQNKDYTSPTIYQMQSVLSLKDWVKHTEIITEQEVEKLKLTTKEGYIFYITETQTEYKGKDNVEDNTDFNKNPLSVTVKNIDTSNLVRKTPTFVADLFDITWESDGKGTVEYSIVGNLNFKNTPFTSTQISSLSELEIGSYTITCKVTSPSNKVATATKENVKVTKLANTVISMEGSDIVANAIYSEYDLAYFRDLVNNGQSNIHAKVMNDIALTTVSSTNNDGWIPIGYFDGVGSWTGPYFAGMFDGNGKVITISSATSMINNSPAMEAGLFGMIIGGRVENLTIDGSISSNAIHGVAGIVGDIKDGVLSNCINHATISGNSADRRAGIAGSSMNSTISECSNTGNISGNSYVGGIVGSSYENSEIMNCTNIGKIICYGSTSLPFYLSNLNICFGGGIVGREFSNSKIVGCSNEGRISLFREPITADYVCLGGIAGVIDDGCHISKSKNKGQILYRAGSNGLLGGIVGYNVEHSVIDQCYNANIVDGRWTSDIGSTVGGIVGWNDGSTIKNCYNTASVSGGEIGVGGIAGGTDNRISSSKTATIYNCYSANLSIVGNGYVGTFMGSLKDAEVKNCALITDTTYVGRELTGITWTSWKFFTIDEMKTENSGLLTMLNSDDGTQDNQKLWAQDASKNDGLPYLLNNMP